MTKNRALLWGRLNRGKIDINATAVYNKMSKQKKKKSTLIVLVSVFLVGNSACNSSANVSQLSCMISSLSHPLLVGIFHCHRQKDPDWLIFSSEGENLHAWFVHSSFDCN